MMRQHYRQLYHLLKETSTTTDPASVGGDDAVISCSNSDRAPPVAFSGGNPLKITVSISHLYTSKIGFHKDTKKYQSNPHQSDLPEGLRQFYIPSYLG